MKTQDAMEILPSIMTLLAHWENMALAIHRTVADEDTCFEMVASTMNQHINVFRNFIADRQEKNQRIYYHHVSALALGRTAQQRNNH